MGYTHYYFTLGKHDPDRWASIFPQLSADAALLITASGVSIKGSSGEGEPVLIDNTIALNGDENKGGAHESFILRCDAGKNGRCCKTAYKLYDKVVTAILIRATQLLGSEYMEGSDRTEIGSDGNWNQWVRGRELVEEVFPNNEVVCPWKI